MNRLNVIFKVIEITILTIMNVIMICVISAECVPIGIKAAAWLMLWFCLVTQYYVMRGVR